MDQIKIGRFISELRRGAGMTQEELGEKIGVTNKTISRWETGTYMPDIEKLMLLSEIFSVSINELLCGERLSDGEFREKADENIVSTLKNVPSPFSVPERVSFWKKKWLRENVGTMFSALAVWAVVCFAVWKLELFHVSIAISVGGIVVYCWLRNKMMSYVEDRTYGNGNIEPPD